MENLQKKIKDVCEIADDVLANPKKSPMTACTNLGLCGSVLNLDSGVGMVLDGPSIIMDVLGIVKAWLNRLMTIEEKECMLREVIKRQEAVINKLQQIISQNRQEIENLNQVLEMLRKVENKINAA